ncbi:MAG: Tim44/TimA family putative adaptor protein [Alphaproteobacteria bacterium]|nr:Tim44/TimA family putative adaptor protein [Alphaproteobacteria bacterium]
MPDSQSLILFVAAMVAGIVCFRLFQVLGRRTGHEPTAQQRKDQQGQDQQNEGRLAAPAALEAPKVQRPSSGGLVEIQLADRKFDISHFVAGAREAYARIVRAFAAGERDQLAPLVSPQVLEAFEGAMAARGDVVPAAFNTLHDARVAGATLEGRHAEITVMFRAEFAPAAEGGAPQDVTDVWTFARDLDSADPNWTLVATAGELPE